MRAPGKFPSTPAGRRLTNQCMTENDVHLWQNGKTTMKKQVLLDYGRGSFVPSRNLGWTETIEKIAHLMGREKSYTDRLDKYKRPLLIQPEQKGMAVMKYLVDKYSQPGDLVYDPFAGSYPTGRVCLSLPLHSRYILRDKDMDCNKYAMRHLVEGFSSQVLNPKSEMTGSSELDEAATLFLKTACRCFLQNW